MDYAARTSRLQELLASEGVEALLVTNLTNVRYLTGFSGTNGQVLIGPENVVFLSDPRYEARASTLVHGAEISIYPSRLSERLKPLLDEAGTACLGVEGKTMTLAEKKDLESRLDGRELTPTSGLVESLRRCKDAAEVALLHEAVALGDRAFTWLLDHLAPGTTEREIALGLEMTIRGWGAEQVSFPPIVGSGELSAHIHHTPTDREFQKGDLILLDFGCRLDGYCSDLTRTVVLGAATDEQRRLYDLVLRAQSEGMQALSAGVTGVAVDRAARSVIEDAGMGANFGHGLGHGVGLDIHEDPRLNRISEDTLAVGDVVTVEPGVYVQGTGGIRIEDCVLVTEEGRQVLGSAPKDELIEL